MGAESKVRRNVNREAARASASRPSHRSRMPSAQEGCARLVPVLLSLTFLSLLLSACPLYNSMAFVQPKTELEDIVTTANQITLQWDPPAASQVVSYTVSYRYHGTSTWITLATIAASPQPAYTVMHSTVGHASFDFAVSATDTAGVTSPLHTSLDPTADPSSGWYLTWD